MTPVQATIARHDFRLEPEEIERLLNNLLPEPLGEHFVVIGGRRFPPKQVISMATGLDRADFNTHQARQVLSRLGFTVGRRKNTATGMRAGSLRPSGSDAELLRPYCGKWVAQRGSEVLVAADSPQAVLAWLERHNQSAEAMFRVPTCEAEATGAAPA